MKVLVTGASGRLGLHVRRRLNEAQGIEAAYWGSPRSNPHNLASSVDLLDTASVEAAVRDFEPEAIIHLAAVAGAACETDPRLARAVNADATLALAAAAAGAGAGRFVFASTAAVYGDRHSSPIDESAAFAGTSTYAKTKHLAEQGLRELCSTNSHFRCASLRVFNIYGDGFSDSLVTRLLESSPSAPVALRDLDDFVRDYVHVDDVVSAISRALDAPLPEQFTAINVGSGIPTSNRALVHSLERARELFYTVARGEPSYSCANIALGRRLLGLDPVSIEKLFA